MSVKEIIPDLLKIAADVLGRPSAQCVHLGRRSRYSSTTGTEKYDLWYATGDRFEFMGILEKEDDLNPSGGESWRAVLISNRKRTKYTMVVPLQDLS